eukprot:scaffold191739_cov45-Prasinocladus_malaysianus.AAC.2
MLSVDTVFLLPLCRFDSPLRPDAQHRPGLRADPAGHDGPGRADAAQPQRHPRGVDAARAQAGPGQGRAADAPLRAPARHFGPWRGAGGVCV